MPNGFTKNKDGSIGYVGFPDEELAPCPINIVTIFDATAVKVYTFIVRNPLNTSEKEFENDIEGFRGRIKEKLRDEHEVLVNDFDFRFFDTEEECIITFFKTIHEIDPDFVLA